MAHQLADEVAVAFFGGDAPGGGVRLAQVAGLGQGGHLVAHGGGADVQVVGFHQALRTDRLGGLDVVADDECQDEFLSIVEFHVLDLFID